MGGDGINYLRPLCLIIDQFTIDYFHCSIPDTVHTLHPQHLILCFELFCHALTLCHLLCQQEHLLRRLFVDVGKICIQSAAGQKLRVQGFSFRRDVPQVPLPSNANRFFFFGWYCQAWNVVISLQLVPQKMILKIAVVVFCIALIFGGIMIYGRYQMSKIPKI